MERRWYSCPHVRRMEPMIPVNRRFSYRSRQIGLLLCCIMLLLSVTGCGVSPLISPATPEGTATVTASQTPRFTPTPIPTATLIPTSTERPALCGGPRIMFILLVGSDARSKGYNAGLADSIRLVRVDFVEPRIQLLPFPRDQIGRAHV